MGLILNMICMWFWCVDFLLLFCVCGGGIVLHGCIGSMELHAGGRFRRHLHCSDWLVLGACHPLDKRSFLHQSTSRKVLYIIQTLEISKTTSHISRKHHITQTLQSPFFFFFNINSDHEYHRHFRISRNHTQLDLRFYFFCWPV